MASEPRTLADTRPAFGAGIARRVRARTAARRGASPLGSVAARAAGFGLALGRSSLHRWDVSLAGGSGSRGASVRPPIEYWPWSDRGGDASSALLATGGDARVAQLARTLGRPPRAVPARRPGVPMTVQRAGTTAAGAGT